MTRSIAKPMSLFLILSFLLFNFSIHKANAEMVATETVLGVSKKQNSREHLYKFLDRQDVQKAMEYQGINPEEAKSRINSLSDAEVTRIAGILDQLPAGGSAVGAVIGAAVFIFVVLLITDLLGLTHVFSFINR